MHPFWNWLVQVSLFLSKHVNKSSLAVIGLQSSADKLLSSSIDTKFDSYIAVFSTMARAECDDICRFPADGLELHNALVLRLELFRLD